jgi:hypothetical protein
MCDSQHHDLGCEQWFPTTYGHKPRRVEKNDKISFMGGEETIKIAIFLLLNGEKWFIIVKK